jgi:transcriptional regulator with XRE-family HTH domain
MTTEGNMQRLGAEIRRRRQALGLSLYAVSKRSELSASHWKGVEEGRSMNLATFVRVAAAVETDPALLLRAAGLSSAGGPEPSDLLAGLDEAERAYVADLLPAIAAGLVRMRARRSRAGRRALRVHEPVAAYDRPFPAPDEDR